LKALKNRIKWNVRDKVWELIDNKVCDSIKHEINSYMYLPGDMYSNHIWTKIWSEINYTQNWNRDSVWEDMFK